MTNCGIDMGHGVAELSHSIRVFSRLCLVLLLTINICERPDSPRIAGQLVVKPGKGVISESASFGWRPKKNAPANNHLNKCDAEAERVVADKTQLPLHRAAMVTG